MIYALRLEKQGIRLYNAETGEYKVVDAYLLANLIQRGMGIANAEQLQEMLSKGKKYSYFIKGMQGNTKLIVANIDTPDKEEVISVYNLDASDFCNAETYRMCLYESSNTDIQTCLIETSNQSAILLDYTVPSEIDYQGAKELVHKTDYDLEQIKEQLFMFGRDLSDVGLEPARDAMNNLGSINAYAPIELDRNSMAIKDGVYHVPQGANICSAFTLRQAPELKLVTFPSTFYSNHVILSLVNQVDCLDMRKASINELTIKINGTGNRTVFHFLVRDLYLPDRLIHLREGDSFYNTSTVKPNYILAKNVYVAKNVKTIGFSCLRAHCIIFERGISLERIAEYGVMARYIIMSDDPRLDYYTNKDVNEIEEPDTIIDLDLGNVDMTHNSIRVMETRNMVKIRMDASKFKTKLSYHNDIVDMQGKPLRG